MDKINQITTSKQTTMYDHLCKMIIGNEEVLSKIIKVVVDEAKHLSIEEIRRLIKGVHIGDRIVNPHFHLVDKEGFIKDEGMVYYDILCYIDVPQKDGKKIRVYLNVEIQNNLYPGYSIITRGQAYIARMLSSQWGREYDDKNYDGMKKVYSLWIMPKAPKIKDGHMNVYETNERIVCGTTAEEKEVYDKGVILVIYLNKEHDLNKKYEVYDELLTPLMVFLNNVLDYKGKQIIIEEYGFDTERIESEVKDMCNLGESIALEARNEGISQGINQGKQIERKEKNIEHVRSVMNELDCSYQRAMDILRLSEDERKDIEKYFQS